MVICTKVEVKIMCGIVGYIGNEQAAPILLDGLAKLEYRGYDSAGIAVYDGTKVATLKSKGRLKVLSELSHDGATLPGTVGIGHTRWQHMNHHRMSMHIRISIKRNPLLLFTMELSKII